MILGLMAESPRDFANDRLAFEKLVRAQHFGLPTRLLDVTTNPLVALYFACEKSDVDGEVLVVNSIDRNRKFFNSDAVSCRANLAFLSEVERANLLERCNIVTDSFIYHQSHYLPDYEQPAEFKALLRDFNTNSTSMRRLLHFIKDEKPYFEPRIDPFDLLGLTVAIPKKRNPRIAAQSGAFVVFGLANGEESNLRAKYQIESIPVLGAAKGRLYKELELVGITGNIVFPEMDKIADQISSTHLRHL